jgi:transposase-like protein
MEENKIYKICTKCNTKNPLENFIKKKDSKDGLHPWCKSCKKDFNTKYYRDKHPINISKVKLNKKEYLKQYNINNKDKIQKYDKKYKTSFKFIKQRKQKRKEKYYTEPKYRIECIIRAIFYLELKSQNSSKYSSIIKLLGCSIEEFKLHLEQQFKPEMTWLNHGEIWEIDHIKPCSSFDLTQLEEQQKCFHFLNQQPLFKTTEIAHNYGYMNEIGNRNKSNKL